MENSTLKKVKIKQGKLNGLGSLIVNDTSQELRDLILRKIGHIEVDQLTADIICSALNELVYRTDDGSMF